MVQVWVSRSLSVLNTMLLVFLCLVGGMAQIDPRFSETITMYHLNPASAGGIPINMNTGDAKGDLKFFLGEFALPIECASNLTHRSQFDCDNPERVDPNLVITKVAAQVDNRWTTYSACNLCNGTDPIAHKPCKNGTYICDCDGAGSCNPTRVGRANLSEYYTGSAPCAAELKDKCGHAKQSPATCAACIAEHLHELNRTGCSDNDRRHFCECTASSPNYDCWHINIARKTLGFWYSTLKEGQCDANVASDGCSWKVLSTVTVKKDCLKDQVITVVEHALPTCFDGCGPRNISSPCWIGCFYDATLGPEANHSLPKKLAGMPIDDIVGAWDKAFLPESEGGCPKLKLTQSTTADVTV